LNYGALSFAVVVTVWGTARIARRLETLRASTLRDGDACCERFRELNNPWGPVAIAIAVAIAFAVAAYTRDGWGAALLRGGTWFVLGIALGTFLWAYASLQLGLHRLGRNRLLPNANSVDPSLGLRPLGSIAFTGLWMLLIWLIPVVWTGLPDVVGLVIALVVLGGGIATFFLSMYRLHRQMIAVKDREVAIARSLYGQAYEPLRRKQTLDVLEHQQSLLGAADALEKRARAIHEWPVDEGTFARVAAIATSVTAATIGRLLLEPLGL